MVNFFQCHNAPMQAIRPPVSPGDNPLITLFTANSFAALTHTRLVAQSLLPGALLLIEFQSMPSARDIWTNPNTFRAFDNATPPGTQLNGLTFDPRTGIATVVLRIVPMAQGLVVIRLAPIVGRFIARRWKWLAIGGVGAPIILHTVVRGIKGKSPLGDIGGTIKDISKKTLTTVQVVAIAAVAVVALQTFRKGAR